MLQIRLIDDNVKFSLIFRLPSLKTAIKRQNAQKTPDVIKLSFNDKKKITYISCTRYLFHIHFSRWFMEDFGQGEDDDHKFGFRKHHSTT